MLDFAARWRHALLAAAISVAVGGCSGGSAASAPPSTPAGSAAAASEVPSASAAPEPTESPANVHMVPALENLLPDLFNKAALKKTSFDGTALGSDIASRQLRQFLVANNRKPTDFGEAGASDPRNPGNITFVVFRVEGVAANLLKETIVAGTLAASPALEITSVTVGGKHVSKGVDVKGIRYIYVQGGYVYGLRAATIEVADQGLALLP